MDRHLTDGVQLVDEDHGRGAFASLRKKVSDPGRASPHEQLHELAGGRCEEGDVGLASHGSSCITRATFQWHVQKGKPKTSFQAALCMLG